MRGCVHMCVIHLLHYRVDGISRSSLAQRKHAIDMKILTKYIFRMLTIHPNDEGIVPSKLLSSRPIKVESYTHIIQSHQASTKNRGSIDPTTELTSQRHGGTYPGHLGLIAAPERMESGQSSN